MKRIKILGRKKPTQQPSGAKALEKPIIDIPKVVSTLGDIGDIVATITKSPLVQELEQRIEQQMTSHAVVEAEKPIKALDIEIKKSPTATPSSTPSLFPSSPPSKESLDSSDILELLEDKKEEQMGIECKQLSDLQMKAKETARFKITLESTNDVAGFMYTIISDKNFIHTSHIENVSGNKINLIINNLSNKDIIFTIAYVAIL